MWFRLSFLSMFASIAIRVLACFTEESNFLEFAAILLMLPAVGFMLCGLDIAGQTAESIHGCVHAIRCPLNEQHGNLLAAISRQKTGRLSETCEDDCDTDGLQDDWNDDDCEAFDAEQDAAIVRTRYRIFKALLKRGHANKAREYAEQAVVILEILDGCEPEKEPENVATSFAGAAKDNATVTVDGETACGAGSIHCDYAAGQATYYPLNDATPSSAEAAAEQAGKDFDAEHSEPLPAGAVSNRDTLRNCAQAKAILDYHLNDATPSDGREPYVLYTAYPFLKPSDN